MTLVVGVSVGYYALFAGDSRETLFEVDNPETSAREDLKKVRETPIGLATGSGLTNMVFDAIEGLSPTEARNFIGDPDELRDYFREFTIARMRALRNVVTDRRVLDEMEHVGWLLSSVEGREVVVRRYHWAVEFEPETFPLGIPSSLLPSDMTVEQSGPNEMRLMKALRPCRSRKDVDGSLDHNLRMILRYFREQVAQSKLLGPGVQIGYHTVDDDIEILPIMLNDAT